MGFRDKDTIISGIRAALPVLRQMEFPPKRIGLFGSVLRGDDTEESDLDILAEFYDNDDNTWLFGKTDMQEKLGELLNHPNVRVSVYPMARAKPEVLADILATVKWIDEDGKEP